MKFLAAYLTLWLVFALVCNGMAINQVKEYGVQMAKIPVVKQTQVVFDKTQTYVISKYTFTSTVTPGAPKATATATFSPTPGK